MHQFHQNWNNHDKNKCIHKLMSVTHKKLWYQHRQRVAVIAPHWWLCTISNKWNPASRDSVAFMGMTTRRKLGHDFGWKKIRSILMYHAATIDPHIIILTVQSICNKDAAAHLWKKALSCSFHNPVPFVCNCSERTMGDRIGARNQFPKRKILWLEKTQRRVYCLG